MSVYLIVAMNASLISIYNNAKNVAMSTLSIIFMATMFF